MRGDGRRGRPGPQRPPSGVVRVWERLTRVGGSTLYGGQTPDGRAALWASAPPDLLPDQRWLWHCAHGEDRESQPLPDGWVYYRSFHILFWTNKNRGQNVRLYLPSWFRPVEVSDVPHPLPIVRAAIALGGLEVRREMPRQ